METIEKLDPKIMIMTHLLTRTVNSWEAFHTVIKFLEVHGIPFRYEIIRG